jgi:hypothetical protein
MGAQAGGMQSETMADIYDTLAISIPIPRSSLLLFLRRRTMRQKTNFHPLLLAIAMLAIFALACDVGGGGATTGGGTQSGTVQAMQSTQDAISAQMTQLAGGAKATTGPAKVDASGSTEAAPAAGGKVEDDFTKGDANWALPPSGITIADGVMTAGPFSNDKAMFLLDTDNFSFSPPQSNAMNAQTFAICKTCGVAQNYTMKVDVKWIDSDTERWLMVLLRFDDQNNNNIADVGKDYMLGFGFSPRNPKHNFSAWEFVPFDRNMPWHGTFADRGPIQSNVITSLKFVSSNNGMKMEIYADGKLFTTWYERKADVQESATNTRLLWSQLTGVKGSPSERMTPIITKGKVGLGVLEKGGAVEYSNFSFEPQ